MGNSPYCCCGDLDDDNDKYGRFGGRSDLFHVTWDPSDHVDQYQHPAKGDRDTSDFELEDADTTTNNNTTTGNNSKGANQAENNNSNNKKKKTFSESLVAQISNVRDLVSSIKSGGHSSHHSGHSPTKKAGHQERELFCGDIPCPVTGTVCGSNDKISSNGSNNKEEREDGTNKISSSPPTHSEPDAKKARTSTSTPAAKEVEGNKMGCGFSSTASTGTDGGGTAAPPQSSGPSGAAGGTSGGPSATTSGAKGASTGAKAKAGATHANPTAREDAQMQHAQARERAMCAAKPMPRQKSVAIRTIRDEDLDLPDGSSGKGGGGVKGGKGGSKTGGKGGQGKGTGKGGGKAPDDTGALRLKNVFAAPLTMVADFVAPNIPKSSTDSAFIKTALGDNFVFDSLEPAELNTLVKAFEKFGPVESGKDVIAQGETGDFFYIIQNGTVKFVVDGNDVGTAGPSASFGELALLYDCPRAATCTATTPCTLWRVDQNTFRKILASHTMTNDSEIRDILKKVPFLKDIETVHLQRITDALTEVKFRVGDTIVKKGDVGKIFYIIKTGKVRVTDIEVGSSKYDDQTLGAGDYFGERAIVTEEPRVANITAAEETMCLCLSRDVFVKVLGDLSNVVTKSQDKRMLRAIPAFDRADLKDYEYDTMADLIEDITFAKDEEISVAGVECRPCIGLVRSGKLSIKNKDGTTEKTLSAGGYFGDDTIRVENKGGKTIKATKTIVATEPTVVGAITLATIESVIGSLDRLKSKSLDLRDKTIKMSDLKKHRILGVGTFGQVWLVSKKGSTSDDDVYALKIQQKRELINHQQVDGVMREKNIMATIDHPFIIKLVNTYTDDRSLYMLLRLVQGGELFSVLHTDTRDGVSEKAAMFYSAGILEGLSYMHRRNILYRDLKPENVLIDSKGYTVIVDLGFAKVVPDKTYTLCGTPLYLAPEVILSRGHDKGADYWSWGVLLYEMVIGQTPFYEHGLDQIGLFKRIVKGKYTYPPFASASDDLQTLIDGCLIIRSSDRLGNLAGADRDIRTHAWYNKMDWTRLLEMGYKAPWVPKLKNALDSSNFDNWDHMAKDADPREKKLSSKEQAQFKGF
mmetsp:Transcript_18238/g.40523  ORF Transcript_18238/g.40523 Transcript_18238/m.40523 type:complete len:1091 (-) Transcript_18238:910-4182(-)